MMRAILGVLVLVLFSAVVAAKDPPLGVTPLIRTVDPASAECGAALKATGDYLDKTIVESLYLTEGANTVIKVEIVKQTADSIDFKIPPDTKAGRYGLMVLTAGGAPQFIDEPAWVNVK